MSGLDDLYYAFDFASGNLYACNSLDSVGMHALAVHEGTVTVVPVPGAAVLGMIGMATAGWLKRRRAL